MSVLPTCMCVYLVCVWCLLRPAEGAGSPETGVTDSFNCLVGAGNQIWVLRKTVQQLLTTEPSLQALKINYYIFFK